ncbi:hypothetical protein [Prauserella muralis]|uniref:hypothetical protein n=1 Tax=Prauserella muralis TaxID=588067 RepID=UPI0011AD13DC|nr:hypothetical protein [Prauserella muralis]TWE22655.1 hypothetical protein FHX69_3905 [Prauserella muralis]
MELFRVLAIAAAPLGILAAIMLSDAWWLLAGFVAFLLLLSGEPQGGEQGERG